MNIKLDRKSGVPIYLQVKNQIMNQIKTGNLKIGEKMVTERELAEKIKVSRNTVSAAYKLLEQEGVLISYQGRGTFVAEEAKTWKQQSVQNRLSKIIELGLEEALEMGLTYEEFLDLVMQIIKDREEVMRRINAVFIECNIEQAKEFSKELTQNTNLNVTSITLSDIENKDEKSVKCLNDSQLVITTFNHVNRVKEITAGQGKEVFGVAINPNLETIVKIARYSRNTKFGLVCLSEEFRFKMENALKTAGISNMELRTSTSKTPENLEDVLQNSDVIIVSPGRYKEIKKATDGKKDVISFQYNLDKDSVKVIVTKILEMKKKSS